MISCLGSDRRVWGFWFVALLSSAACSPEPSLSVPYGVDKDAVPKIVVVNEKIAINAQLFALRKNPPDSIQRWDQALGAPRMYSDGRGRGWLNNSVHLTVAKEKYGIPYADHLRIYLRQSDYMRGRQISIVGPADGSKPVEMFSGHLEISGIPIGTRMRLEELQKWRRRLGLVLLEPDGEMGYYRVGEDYQWAQHYYFEDGFLTYIDFL